jgi:flagellar hook-associated protein 1
MSLTGILATASRSLQNFALGIQVSGNNLANAATPGFVRDELVLTSAPSYPQGGVLVGAGAVARGVKQEIDIYLETRIHRAKSEFAAADARRNGYLQLQTAVQELGDNDLSSRLNALLGTVQGVVNQPQDPASRSQVIEQGRRFADDVQDLRSRIEELRSSYSNQVQALVGEANSLIDTIQQLNPQISRLEANGLADSDAGALRVQRLNAIQRLAEIIPVRVQELPSGAVDLFTGPDYLILGNNKQHLNSIMAPTESSVATVNVELSRTRAPLGSGGGELNGLIQARDQVLTGFITQLDTFVGQTISEFNKIHSSGEGLIGFQTVTSERGAEQLTAPLSQAGLPFDVSHGSFQVKLRNLSTGQTVTTRVAVDLDGIGTDTSLTDLQGQLNAVPNLQASITALGQLKLNAAAGYEIRFGDDTSGVLSSLGINTFFSGEDSGNIGMQDHLLQDARFLATGRGGGPGDNTNAQRMANVLDQPVESLQGLTLSNYYDQMIGTTAQAANAETALADGLQSFRDSLQTQREQRSGVNLDEEAINVINLQRNYQAVARIISTVDELMNTLLNSV